MKKTYIVIGLGRFGCAVAQRLYELGSEVLAIDLRPELVQRMESKVTCAAVCDVRDEDALRTLGVRNYDCAVIAIGGDLATSVVATLNLKELGVQSVVCKATDETQRRALEKIGADHVSLENALYETISALCTVGLTTGITSSLCAASQIVLIIFMFFGRLGIMTISVGFMAADRAKERVSYAETKIMIG